MKLWVISKKTFVFSVVFVLALLFVLLFARNDAMPVSSKQKDLPIYCVDTGEEKNIAISFDAAWGNEDTHRLIEILDKYQVKATFFVVGSWVDHFPDSVKELSDAGHEIMNHSDSHPHMTQINKDKSKQEIIACSNKIEQITGVRPNLFRAPYGDYNDAVVQAARECGCYTIQWSIDSLDWQDLTAEEIKKRVCEKARPGGIVLFHNAALHTPEALPKILENLQQNGYQFKKVSELIYKDSYRIDNTGMQHKTSAE